MKNGSFEVAETAPDTHASAHQKAFGRWRSFTAKYKNHTMLASENPSVPATPEKTKTIG